MSFARGPSSSTPQQPSSRGLYPSLNLQTPATPTPSNTTTTQPLQQKPPPRPASVPLNFGLSHSASTPSLNQAFNQNTSPTQQSTFPSQSFSPAPQPPLSTYDLGGPSPFTKPAPMQWGGIGGHTLSRSQSQQFMPQGMTNPLGERRYLPSHLRSYSPERSSPLASKEPVIRERETPVKEKRRVSFGSVSTFGHPSTSSSNFGGTGFGTPKDDPKSKSRREEDDLPPSASVYDFSHSSPFSKQEAARSPSPPPDITPSLFSSVPPSSPGKLDPTPVILFGFPPSHTSFIIHEYEKYGPILEHFSSIHSTPSTAPPPEILQGSNWVRITYADPVSAARAIATNGQLIGGAYMIGVVYATKKAEPQESEERKEESRGNATPGGERKMNVVRGGEMFAKKEIKKVDTPVSWTTWIWEGVFGSNDKGKGTSTGNVQSGIVAGGGQSNVLVRAVKGLSETIFGF